MVNVLLIGSRFPFLFRRLHVNIGAVGTRSALYLWVALYSTSGTECSQWLLGALFPRALQNI